MRLFHAWTGCLLLALTGCDFAKAAVSQPEASAVDVEKIFAASDMHRERVRKRLEIAARLRSGQFRDQPLLQDDLAAFDAALAEEVALWQRYPENPDVVAKRLSVADFGAVGDGVTPNDAAFDRALDAVLAHRGEPTVLTIPAGTYFFAGDIGKSAHVRLVGVTNCVVRGAGPERTRFVFGNEDLMGVRVHAAYNATFAGVEIRWKNCPFAQGVVEKVDRSTDPHTLVLRHLPGTKRPDDPHYRKTGRDQVCGTFDALGRQVLGCPLFFAATEPEAAVDLGGGRFRVKLDKKHRTSYEHAVVEPGMTVVIPDRANGIEAVGVGRSRFVNLDSVWVRNAPEAAFVPSGSDFVTGWKLRVFPLEPGHLLSTGADTFFNSPGAFLAHGEFRNMNDDGANCHYRGTPLKAFDAAKRTVTIANQLVSHYRAGEPFQVYRATTGELLATLHLESKRLVPAKRGVGNDVELVFREPPPAGLLTEENLGIHAPTKEERYALSHGVGEKPKTFADVLYAPHGLGIGYVVTDCTFANFRGIGVNTQCPNTLIENCRFEDVNNGVQVSSLMMWYEGLPCYNLVVRNCGFRRLARGVCGFLSTVTGGPCHTDYIRGVLVESNVFENVKTPIRFSNSRDVVARGNVIRTEGKLGYSLRLSEIGNPTNVVTVDEGDSKLASVKILERTGPEGERRLRIKVDIADGWQLEETAFPIIRLAPDIDLGPGEMRLALGGAKGGVVTNPLARKPGWYWPARFPGSMVAAYAAAYGSEKGLYLAAEDPGSTVKVLAYNRDEAGVYLSHRVFECARGHFETDYDVVLRTVTRAEGAEELRWEVFADIYRAWNDRQAWMRTPYVDRSDVPDWLKRGPAMVRFSRQWLEEPENIVSFMRWWRRTFGEGDVVAALWGWEKEGTWWGPDYFPCHPDDDTFRSNLAALRAEGFHPFPWPSGYNWCKYIGRRPDGSYRVDYRDTLVKDAADHLCVNRDGTHAHRDAFWLENGALTTLCGGDPWTRAWWDDLTRRLGARGSEIVQVDQVVGGRLGECWSDRHGHAPGHGKWELPAFLAQLDTMKAALRGVVPDGVVAVEEPCERFIDKVGIQDYRDLETEDTEEHAGVYSYLYHGYMQMFQSNPIRGDLHDLAYMAVEGQIPFFKPLHSDLLETRPALENGGFEDLVDSVRGPAAWERHLPGRVRWRGADLAETPWDAIGWNNMGWLGIGVNLDHAERHGGKVSLRLEPTTGKPWQYCPPTLFVAQTVTGLAPGDYDLSAWVKTASWKAGAEGALLFGTRRGGEAGRIAFPAAGAGWRRITARVHVKDELRLVIRATPGYLGWIDDLALTRADGTEATVSGDTPYIRFLRNWISLYRGEGRDFLANGFRIRPPRVACATSKLGTHVVPAIRSAAYRAADGRTAVALANGTEVEQTCSFVWGGDLRRLTLKPGELRLEEFDSRKR